MKDPVLITVAVTDQDGTPLEAVVVQPERRSKEDSVALSARLPLPLFVKLKTKVAEQRTTIQDVICMMVTKYVEGEQVPVVGYVGKGGQLMPATDETTDD